MRDAADLNRIQRFMRELGRRTRESSRVYLTGGATAVLHGWRDSTIDVDVKLVPERDDLFRAIQDLKETLRLNVELASPVDFIPVRGDWEDRSPFITRQGQIAFHHFDYCAQALSKIERDHEQDRHDVRQFLDRGLINREQLGAYFAAITPQIYRYPALDPVRFRQRVQTLLDHPA
ncbi:MAG: DUF6036 family nucleotidyltransferase [Vicinamibacterales bacterium]